MGRPTNNLVWSDASPTALRLSAGSSADMAAQSCFRQQASLSKAALQGIAHRGVVARERAGANLHMAYRPDIDGLRAIAVLAVLGFHCGVPWLSGGFVGVDVFFVISGYLICSVIHREIQQGSFSIARFYMRRFKRIIPALSVVVIFCLCAAALVFSPYEATRLGESAVATSLSGSNFLFLIRTGYFAARAANNPLLMTWSLAVEEQFYIVFPLLMLLLARKTRRDLLLVLGTLTLLSFASSVYAEFRQPIWNFYLPATRAWELGAGAFLAIWEGGMLASEVRQSWTTNVSGAAGLLMIMASVLFYRPEMRFPGYEAGPAVVGSLLILAAPGAWTNRLLKLRPLVAVGLISYSLYLWHWPLLSFAKVISSKPLRPETIAILMTVACAMAIASYFFVEKPFRAKTSAKISTVLISYSVWILALAATGAAFTVTRGLPQRYPHLYAIENGADLYRHHPCISAGDYLRLSDHCAPAPTSQPAMAVLGDSHAEALSVGLQSLTERDGWKLVTLTRESCPPTEGVTAWSSSEVGLRESCGRFNRASLHYVLRRPDIKVVLLAGRWAIDYVPDSHAGDPATQTKQQNAANLRLGLSNEIATLQSAGKQVILIEDAPAFPYDPVAGVRNQQIWLRRVLNRALRADQPEQGDGSSESRSAVMTAAFTSATAQVAALKTENPKLILIDPKQVLCRGVRCFFANGSDLYYYDAMHLSLRGALQVVPLLPDLRTMR